MCVVKVAELWDRLTWLRGRSFRFAKDDVLDADPSRSRGFRRSAYLAHGSGAACLQLVEA